MNLYAKIALFGIAIWVIAFIVGSALYTQEGTPRLNLLLTQNIFYLLITLTTVYFCLRLLKPLSADYVRQGALIGISWLVIAVVLDLAILLPVTGISLMQWTQEIFPMLFAFPIITIGLGAAMARSRSSQL